MNQCGRPRTEGVDNFCVSDVHTLYELDVRESGRGGGVCVCVRGVFQKDNVGKGERVQKDTFWSNVFDGNP